MVYTKVIALSFLDLKPFIFVLFFYVITYYLFGFRLVRSDAGQVGCACQGLLEIWMLGSL